MALNINKLPLSSLKYRLPCNFSITKLAYCTKKVDVPKNELENLISAHTQTENGVIYDKKPFRIALEAGKRYSWCLCGRSKTQPFCDGTHKIEQLKIKQKPIRFQVAESKEYWLCNCKQTNKRPFCDGTHKQPVVQEGSSIIRQ